MEEKKTVKFPDLGGWDHLLSHQAHLPISPLGSPQNILVFRTELEI